MASRFRMALVYFLDWLLEGILHLIRCVALFVIIIATALGCSIGVYCLLSPRLDFFIPELAAYLTWYGVLKMFVLVGEKLSGENDKPP